MNKTKIKRGLYKKRVFPDFYQKSCMLFTRNKTQLKLGKNWNFQYPLSALEKA